MTIALPFAITPHAEGRFARLTGQPREAATLALQAAEPVDARTYRGECHRVSTSTVARFSVAFNVLFILRPEGRGLECFEVWRPSNLANDRTGRI